MPRNKFPVRTPSPAWLSSSMPDSTSDEAQSPELPAQQEPGVPEGAHCTIQTLYEGRSRCFCCKNWVKEYPKDLRTAMEEQAGTKQKALVARMAKNHGDGKPLVLNSIVVQSSSLRKTLEKVFQGYRGITASLKKLVFKAPFHPFYYRWGVLTRILERQKEEDPDAAAYTELLYGLLDAEMSDLRAEINDLLHHRVITYPHLWALFEPGTRVVMNADGNERFFTVIGDEYREEKDGRRNDMSMHSRFVEWDGKRFVFTKTTFVINKFNGTRAIDELDVFPASFYPSLEEAERKAIARGRKFQGLRGFHYMSYSGLAMSLVDRPRGRIQGLQKRQRQRGVREP